METIEEYIKKVIKKQDFFISEKECNFFKDSIKGMIRDKKNGLEILHGTRPTFLFGDDEAHSETSTLNFDSIKEIKKEIRELTKKVIKKVKDDFEEDKELYVSSLWLASQNPDSEIIEHEDTDQGYNTHFEYSCIVYLNTLFEGGELSFLQLRHVVNTKKGDLVCFKTKETGRHRVSFIPEHRYSICIWLTYDKEKSFNI